VYPVWSYTYFAMMVPVFLITDLLRYKPLISWEAAAYAATWALLIWGRSVPEMQLMQVVYGMGTASEIAYYTYIYAKVTNSFRRSLIGSQLARPFDVLTIEGSFRMNSASLLEEYSNIKVREK
jgi:thiamine transporter 2/3